MKSALVFSLLSGALAMPAPAAPAHKKVPLGRKSMLTRENGEANVPGFFASINSTLHKYKSTPLPYYAPVAKLQAEMAEEAAASRLAKKQTNEPLIDQYAAPSEDAAYYGAVAIGADDGSAQTFNLIFDTGSADIWIPGADCSRLDGCVHSTKYDAGGNDLGTITNITYGSGSTSGENYIDDVTVAGLTVAEQVFFAVTTAVGFTAIDADGICGMAFSSIAQDGGTTFFENLMADGTVTTDEFAFYMGRLISGTEQDSVMTLGGRDSDLYTGDFVTVPVTSETYWQVALDSVKVGGATVGLAKATAGQAAIDTGTSLVVAPTAQAKKIMKAIDGTLGIPLEGEIIYLYPCATDESLIPSITFAGEDFPINPLDFNVGPLVSTDVDLLVMGNATLGAQVKAAMGLADMCLAGIMGADITDTEVLYVVGDVFIKNYYSVFSYSASNGSPAVLFAPSLGYGA